MNKKALTAGLVIGAGIIYMRSQIAEYVPEEVSAEISDPFGALSYSLDELTGETDVNQESKNMQAFLMTIRKWESSTGPEAYRMLFGGSLFNGFADHPRIAKPYGNQYTSAAGAYQIVAVSKTPKGMTKMDTWDRIKRKLKLPDFSPASQDAAAIELIKERGAYFDVLKGDFESAVKKVGKEWASVPGSPYGQPVATFPAYQAAYLSFGGNINA